MSKDRIELPFKYVDVIASPLTSGTTISWQLNPRYTFADPALDFYVEFAYSGGEWERLNPSAPETDLNYVDLDKRRYNYRLSASYRVVANDGVEEHISTPTTLNGIWNTHDYLIARDIIRKLYLKFTKYGATAGYLMKRRMVGPKCGCIDHDAGEPTTPSCPDCYGTNLETGYYNAVPYYIEMGQIPHDINDASKEDVKLENPVRAGMGIAYPRVDSLDVWVEAQTNQRYIIRKATPKHEVRGKALTYILELRPVSGAAHLQDLPPEQTSPDGKTQEGWQTGMSNQTSPNRR